MKRPLHKHTTIAILLLVCIVLSACGNNAPTSVEALPAPRLAENSEEVYLLPDGTEIIGAARLESTLFLLGVRDETPVLACSDIQTDENGKATFTRASELAVHPTNTEDCIAYAVTAGGDGKLYLLLGNMDEHGASTELYIQQYSADGTYLDEMLVADWPYLTVECFGVGQQGEISLCTDNVVSVYRWQEGLLAQNYVDDFFMQSASACNAGLVLSLLPRNAANMEKSPYYRIDPATGSLSQIDFSIAAPSGDAVETLRRKSGSAVACQGLHGEYLANQGDGIYWADFETGGFEKLIEWSAESGGTQKLGSSCRLNENSFLCVLNGRAILAWVEELPTALSGQTPVRVAVFDGTSSQGLARMVKNAASGISSYEYTVEVFNWDHRERITTEIVTGAWDLVLFHDELDTGNAFDDLYPYLDADPGLSRESFVPHLLESLENDGELHQLWNCATVSTFVSAQSLIPDPNGLTLDDCDEIVRADGEIPSVFFQMYNAADNQQRLLGMIARAGAVSFVDKENASCCFDCDAFRNMLLWCSHVPAYQDAVFDKSELLQSRLISSAADIARLEPLIGGKPVITGFPNGDSGIHYFTLGSDDEKTMAMAIPSAGINKDGAWAFIREMLSKSRQNSVAGGSDPDAMPVIYEVVKFRNETAQAEYRDMFYDMLENTRSSMEGDRELIELIKASCLPYLKGEKTLDETIRVIQSRAGIYVAEKYG